MANFIMGVVIGIALSVFGTQKIVNTIDSIIDGTRTIITESIEESNASKIGQGFKQNINFKL
tara:strand:- start:143 stop:328 length:186 start_codon:yes stop_codon:yes gene_type:complete